MGNQLCKCGCGKEVRLIAHRYVHGHNIRGMSINRQGMLGKTHTKEARNKIKVAILERYAKGWKVPLTKEYRKKLSLALRNVKHTWNTKKGYVCSKESRERYRAARAKRVFPFKDSSIEQKLQNELISRGHVFKRHYPILGQPDFAWPDKRVLVFADGRFFHGDPREFRGTDKQLSGKTMKEIREKDAKITSKLKSLGWVVLRFWEKEINTNVNDCVDIIEKTLEESRGVDYERTE